MTELVISGTTPRVGRTQINHEQTPARFAEGTLAKIDAALVLKEKRSDFIREAVERELQRREQQKSEEAISAADAAPAGVAPRLPEA